jgi:putative inorganic carbon (HCO3(-)) transporter
MQIFAADDSTRAADRGLGATGFLLPLLAGGNFFGWLEPAGGMAAFDLVALALCGLLLRTSRREGARHDAAGSCAAICLFLLLAWWGASLALRPSGPRAVLEARGIFAAVLLFLTVANARLGPASMWAFVAGLLGGVLLTAAFGQYQYWIAFPRTVPLLAELGIPVATFVNANFYNANCYAAFLAASVLLAVGLAAASPSRTCRWLLGASIAALLVTLLLSESRSAVALLGLAAAGWASLGLGSRAGATLRHALPRVAIAAALTLAVVLATVDLRDLWGVGFLGRVAIWRGSLAMIRDHWLSGVGLGRFSDYFPRYQVTTYYTRYPHSFLLEAFAELGVVAALALTGFLISAAVAPLRSILRLGTDRTAVARWWPLLSPVAACGVLLLHGLVDIDWHAPANPILLFTLLAFAQHLPSWTRA